jgi:hypothetical protein
MSLGRKSYNAINKVKNIGAKRPSESKVLPSTYKVCNTRTFDSDYTLNVLEGDLPSDLNGSMYITQCLGVPDAFMVGDTNLVKMDFSHNQVLMKNRLAWTPSALARQALKGKKHRFDYFGLMYLSPGLGLFSYTEGMYLLPDGRLSITSDVDRPWIIDNETLRVTGPIGRRDEWIPMMKDQAGDVMGTLFSGYSNSHVMYPDVETNETFFVSYQYKQADGSHPVKLMRWDGYGDFDSYFVIDENGDSIEIKQSIHELVFTKDYILLADTAFIAGTEMLTPWKNAPLPYEKTVVYIVNRNDMQETDKVVARRVEVDEPCIHLISEYDNPEDMITLYMLHTPATNTAEILKPYDRTIEGKLFHQSEVGYGTLPVLDLSSVGKHKVDMKTGTVVSSDYIRDEKFTWGPYLYTYMDRQVKHFNKQDLFIMFKGFDRNILPSRIFKAYKDIDNRYVPVNNLLDNSIKNNNSIVKIDHDSFTATDYYEMPDKVLLYTISCMKSSDKGYVLAGVCTDQMTEASSGHEYWVFDGDDLCSGPICKLGHKALCNSTIFHTIFISDEDKAVLDRKEKSYHIPLEKDYPLEEVNKWGPEVSSVFTEIIYPYYQGHTPYHIREFSLSRENKVVDTEGIIGEKFVNNPSEVVEEMMDETRILLSTTGWNCEYDRDGLIVESKPIHGDLEPSGVNITRSRKVLNASAKETFDMLTSPEGYAVIDPISKEDDHKEPPLEVFEWKNKGRLEAAVATTNLPMMPESEFVVLNAIDYDHLIFASKSILHSKIKGSSKYGPCPSDASKERALNTFAIVVKEVDDETCLVECINYADMGGKSAPFMNNFVNKKMFFPPLYKRIQKKMDEMKSGR